MRGVLSAAVRRCLLGVVMCDGDVPPARGEMCSDVCGGGPRELCHGMMNACVIYADALQ